LNEDLRIPDYLNNNLLLDIMRILSKMIKFDVYLHLEKKKFYFKITQFLFCILEFDKDHPTYSYAIQQIRGIFLSLLTKLKKPFIKSR